MQTDKMINKKTTCCNRFGLLLLVMALLLAAIPALAACQPQQQANKSIRLVRIGTLPIEDMLPFWVAEKQGLFNEMGLTVVIITYESSVELAEALAGGYIDMALTSPMTAVSLAARGIPLKLLWVALGTDSTQGRFGVLANPERGIYKLADLAGVPVAIGIDTLPEYAFDQLMVAAGIPSEAIVYEVIQKPELRYQLLASNQLAAAALPASLLYQGQLDGMVLIADDSTGENLSQSIMVARLDYCESVADSMILAQLEQSWNSASVLVNTHPEACCQLLAEKTRLSDLAAVDYPISSYPLVTKPDGWMIDDIQAWMIEKGYLTFYLRYDSASGVLSR
ncbi:MAG: ABC transporter substrate-binding protein [Coriobacteriales bacterium]|jgi:NitT/TauT family transport system substrate-binding protein|nr:ABC transporter substrate-binding protein [Coriobacteriales bacterium]